MIPTRVVTLPVLTFLSPSRKASKAAVTWLDSNTSFRPMDCGAGETDTLGRLLEKSILPAVQFHSAAVECSNTGCKIHFISSGTTEDGQMELMGISTNGSIAESRRQIATSLQNRIHPVLLRSLVGAPIEARHILGDNELPFIDVDENSQRVEEGVPFSPGCLKEMALPISDEALYPDGRTLREVLARSHLPRPVTGLYYLGDSTCLRPLPVATEDRIVSAPTLVFHVANYDDFLSQKENDDDIGTKCTKIGFNGSGRGQLMLRSPSLPGIDIRLCDCSQRSTMFSEAQESLLAASLGELQSAHVLEGASGEVDPKANNADCWVEFRANVSHPRGFLSSSRQGKVRVAKAPDIPFE